MNSKEDVEILEKIVGQLEGLHSEISQLARKSPNDAVNKFKLTLVNKVLETANRLLVGRYRPFDSFDQFDDDSLPTNSDVTVMIAQYIEHAEHLRSDNVIYASSQWWYVVRGQPSDIKSRPPTRVGGERK